MLRAGLDYRLNEIREYERKSSIGEGKDKQGALKVLELSALGRRR